MELRPPAVVGPERELSGEEERASPHLAPPAPPAAGQQAPSDRQEGQLTEGEGRVVYRTEIKEKYCKLMVYQCTEVFSLPLPKSECWRGAWTAVVNQPSGLMASLASSVVEQVVALVGGGFVSLAFT